MDCFQATERKGKERKGKELEDLFSDMAPHGNARGCATEHRFPSTAGRLQFVMLQYSICCSLQLQCHVDLVGVHQPDR